MDESIIDLSFVPEGAIAHLRTARSCAFECAFCSYPSVSGKLATMSVDHVLSMLSQAKARRLKGIFFTDDTFNVPRDRFRTLIDRVIQENLQIPWYSFLRCQHVDRDLVFRMRDAGCEGVYLGIESGSDEILRNMKKGARIKHYRRGIEWLKSAGILTVGSFLLGFPGETEETVAQTERFIRTSGLDFYYIQPFFYLHHSPVHQRAAEFGLTGRGLFWKHDTMSSATAAKHINRLFCEIDQPIFLNPDYTLWEVAYLKSIGMSMGDIREYRHRINAMTKQQMAKFGLVDSCVTSRDTAAFGASSAADRVPAVSHG